MTKRLPYEVHFKINTYGMQMLNILSFLTCLKCLQLVEIMLNQDGFTIDIRICGLSANKTTPHLNHNYLKKTIIMFNMEPWLHGTAC